jgi:hypothetical protein
LTSERNAAVQVIRVRAHLDSETLRLPGLKEFVGRDVEVVVSVRDCELSNASTFRNDCSALAALAGQDLVDPEVRKRK